MRRSSLLLLALSVMVASPAIAGTDYSKHPVFGRSNCAPAFPCSDLQNSEKATEVTQKIVAIAERCSASATVTAPEGGIFESSYGLDSSLCLTTKKNLPAPISGGTITPVCCVTPSPSSPDICQVTCTRYSIK